MKLSENFGDSLSSFHVRLEHSKALPRGKIESSRHCTLHFSLSYVQFSKATAR